MTWLSLCSAQCKSHIINESFSLFRELGTDFIYSLDSIFRNVELKHLSIGYVTIRQSTELAFGIIHTYFPCPTELVIC